MPFAFAGRAAAFALGLAAAMPAGAQTVRFDDMTGRPVTLQGPAKRIVSVVAPTASTVISIDGSPNRLAGVNPIATGTFRAGIVGRAFPGALAIPNTITAPGAGIFAPSVESIARLSPDLVIQAGYAGQDIVQPLLNAGFTTALYMWGTEEQARQVNAMIGTILAQPDRAARMNAWRADSIARIKAAAAAVPANARQKVVQLSPVGGSLRVWGRNTIADFAIALAGASNAAAAIDGMGMVNVEQMAAWNPDVIFLFNSPETTRAAILADPILSATAAGRSGRVYVLPTGSVNWGSTGEDDPLFWSFVAKLTYPAIHQSDLTAEMRQWFKFMYGHDLSPEEARAMLLAERNGAAPSYATILDR